MKKSTLLLFGATCLLFNFHSFAQENVLPENGNVGLGTTTPSARLTVAGSTRIDSTLTVNDSVIMASGARVGEDLKVDGDLYLPNLASLTTLNTETILLTTASGRTIKATASVIRDALYSRNCSVVGGVIPSPTWANGPNKLFSECPEVLVGIGTATPSRNLDVVGSAKISAHLWANQSLSVGADMNTFSKLSVVNSNRTAVIHGNAAGNTQPYQRLLFFEYDKADTKIMEVMNTATSRTPFVLKANGELDIDNGTGRIFHLGTDGALELTNGTMQTFKVETTGMIRGRRMKLDLNTWADYVFEADYRLMPLDEVEQFVKKEKHLPNVPSEQELKASGADVMELNKILMEKVEELTLYLIQQNKNTEELKQQVEVLQNKVTELEKAQN